MPLRPRRPPRFISCPNGTLFRVLSHNNSQKILDTSHKDLEIFCFRRLWQMSEVSTHNAREQVLLQGPKALDFVKTLHRLYCLLQGVLTQSNHIVSLEVLIENRYRYKQQEAYLCFDGDFDNDNNVDDEAGSNVSLPPSIIPTTTPTTTAANLLLSLINQVPATSPPPSPPLLSPFNFSYIDVTPSQTTTHPSTDSGIVISSSLALSIKTNPCDNYDTAIFLTLFDRITSCALLSLHLLISSWDVLLGSRGVLGPETIIFNFTLRV